MRIVAGRFRGLKLEGGEGQGIRPTADRTREGLFNIIAHGSDWRGPEGPAPAGLSVLDAFAGSGALGLEALSRGASALTFIENSETSIKILKSNISKARSTDQTSVVRADATRPGRARRAHDLVLMDPPYGQQLAERSLPALADGGWLKPGCGIIVETDAKDGLEWPDGFTGLDTRRYGRAVLHFGQWTGGAD